ncbi:hypothetical protein AGMMS49944_27410 [Spirochaetia bacterium]|nr:hypothetical protein AGMMS49944_27410 [Spirochaetia bacterium]
MEISTIVKEIEEYLTDNYTDCDLFRRETKVKQECFDHNWDLWIMQNENLEKEEDQDLKAEVQQKDFLSKCPNPERALQEIVDDIFNLHYDDIRMRASDPKPMTLNGEEYELD